MRLADAVSVTRAGLNTAPPTPSTTANKIAAHFDRPRAHAHLRASRESELGAAILR
jgi:hypothetical protein